jgi:hypothetical protein
MEASFRDASFYRQNSPCRMQHACLRLTRYRADASPEGEEIMIRRKLIAPLVGALGVLAFAVLGVRVALAHCDGLDGPVVKAAKNALQAGNVNLVLIWVQQKDEPEIRAAFQQTLHVRKQSPEAQALADRSFFETLVRIHRAGEGASYTGLKPAGRDLGPAIPAADRALEAGAVGPLQDLLADAVRRGLREHFEALSTLKGYDANDVAAGRRYVQAYVEYIHYVERVHEATTTAAMGHYAEAAH